MKEHRDQLQVRQGDQPWYPIQDRSFVAHGGSRMPCAPACKLGTVTRNWTCDKSPSEQGLPPHPHTHTYIYIYTLNGTKYHQFITGLEPPLQSSCQDTQAQTVAGRNLSSPAEWGLLVAVREHSPFQLALANSKHVKTSQKAWWLGRVESQPLKRGTCVAPWCDGSSTWWMVEKLWGSQSQEVPRYNHTILRNLGGFQLFEIKFIQAKVPTPKFQENPRK